MNIFGTFFLSFITCGIICGLAQIIIDNSKLTPGHVCSIFVVIGAILEFFNLYKYLRIFGGIGASLPICSFGSLIMKGVKESIVENGFLGIFEGVFKSCGTIIAMSLFLAFLATLFFKPKS